MKSRTSVFVVALSIACVAALPAEAGAAVTVDKMFSDHMVLQRGLAVPVWGTAGPGEKVSVTFRGRTRSVVADAAGKWSVRLDPQDLGEASGLTVRGPNTVTFTDVLVGEVWIGSGQSNMAGGAGGYARNDAVLAKMIEDGPYSELRLYRGGWSVADAAAMKRFSALHLSFGLRLHKELGVPVGLMVGAVGGTPSGRWLTKEMAAANADLVAKMEPQGGLEMTGAKEKRAESIRKWEAAVRKAKAEKKRPPRKPRGPIRIGDLYDKHIRYMVPFGIRGVLWDQGESKTQLPGVDQFTAMTALIGGWREVWGQGDFHFLHVQKPSGGGCAWDYDNPVNRLATKIAKPPGSHYTKPSALAYNLDHIRIATIRNAPLVTASDLAGGIHPPTKSAYGARACRVALGAVYGRDVAICGPVYRSHRTEGASIRVTFDHVGKGLAFRHAGKLQGFEIAGVDGKWAWADATIDDDAVILRSDVVPEPRMVQYAFNRKFSYANLFNNDGLPALMFSTATRE
jgi:sialate O-acetylesterase